jgi:hypothetical protein
MCSETRGPARRALPLACFALLAPLALACGKQGDPRPRPRPVPQPANDLALRLRGGELLVEASYPRATVAGLPLEGLAAATLYEVATPAGSDGQPPELREPEYAALARPVVELSGAALDEAIVGDTLRLRHALPPAALEGKEARIYALRTTERRGLASPWSNRVALVPRAAPPAPGGLAVTPEKEGVALAWSAAPEAQGYVVLRREATERDWGAPLATLPATALAFFDRSARYGTRYVYTVLALAQSAPPIESAPQSAREVDYRDLFPPQPPTELRALAVAGDVRLVWEASPDADLAGYRVERSVGGGGWTILGGLVSGTDAVDRTAPTAGVVRYRLAAVDRAGNASRPIEPVEIVLP